MIQQLKNNVFLLSSVLLALGITPAQAKEHIVEARSGGASEMRFFPESLEVSLGDTVTWVNASNVYHNVKSLGKDIPKEAEPLKSPGLRKKGDKWSYTFNVPGEYKYFCVPHRAMGMVGQVIAK